MCRSTSFFNHQVCVLHCLLAFGMLACLKNNTIKPAHVVTSIQQSAVLKGHLFLWPSGDLLIQVWLKLAKLTNNYHLCFLHFHETHLLWQGAGFLFGKQKMSYASICLSIPFPFFPCIPSYCACNFSFKLLVTSKRENKYVGKLFLQYIM